MASNYWLFNHEDVEVFRCRDCELLVRSIDHECGDATSVFTEAEVDQMKAGQ